MKESDEALDQTPSPFISTAQRRSSFTAVANVACRRAPSARPSSSDGRENDKNIRYLCFGTEA